MHSIDAADSSAYLTLCRSVVCLCALVTNGNPAETHKPIKMPLGGQTRVASVLGLHGSARQCHAANTMLRSVQGLRCDLLLPLLWQLAYLVNAFGMVIQTRVTRSIFES